MYFDDIVAIPGWFHLVDFLVFQEVDRLQSSEGATGDLLEIGVFQGRSAVLLGSFARKGERLVVCDIFDASSRRAFEKNYLRFHGKPPEVLACDSKELPGRGLARSFRFIHVDGAHDLDGVRADIATARGLLIDGGIIAFDDYEVPEFPGVAAAVDEAVAAGGLIPLCRTENKLYAACGDGPRLRAALRRQAQAHPRLQAVSADLLGREVLFMSLRDGLVARLIKTFLPSRFWPHMGKVRRFFLGRM